MGRGRGVVREDYVGLPEMLVWCWMPGEERKKRGQERESSQRCETRHGESKAGVVAWLASGWAGGRREIT